VLSDCSLSEQQEEAEKEEDSAEFNDLIDQIQMENGLA
jgi:hypothetical protein